MEHRVGKGGSFVVAEAAQVSRHQEGAHLIIRHVAVGVGGNQAVDRLVGERFTVALAGDRIDGAKLVGWFPVDGCGCWLSQKTRNALDEHFAK
jgi:hypothetical protein